MKLNSSKQHSGTVAARTLLEGSRGIANNIILQQCEGFHPLHSSTVVIGVVSLDGEIMNFWEYLLGETWYA